MASAEMMAKATWEMENNVQPLPAGDDQLFQYDEQEQAQVMARRPWARDPHYFKHVRISALALIKMTMHTRAGGNLEVMGMLQGKTIDDTFVVIDSFALPVEGTETRVNAQSEANEYMVEFLQSNKAVGRLENIVGWYHSHPGYGCWMSGIDCATQIANQQYQDPFLALVVDPVRTVAAGKVEIGAFRTYPEGYKPPDEQVSEYQSIPLNKIEDFGVHAKQYYSLDISYFKSSLDAGLLDLLWNKYWINTLSSTPLLGNRDFMAGQLADVAEKLEQADGQMSHSGRMGTFLLPSSGDRKKEDALAKASHDCSKVASQHLNGLISQVIKEITFNSSGSSGNRLTTASAMEE